MVLTLPQKKVWQYHSNNTRHHVSFKLASLYCGSCPILVYPNLLYREADERLTHKFWGIIGIKDLQIETSRKIINRVTKIKCLRILCAFHFLFIEGVNCVILTQCSSFYRTGVEKQIWRHSDVLYILYDMPNIWWWRFQNAWFSWQGQFITDWRVVWGLSARGEMAFKEATRDSFGNLMRWIDTCVAVQQCLLT